MLRFFRTLLLLAVIACPALVRGATVLDHMRHARALLGSDHWSKIIRVENTNERSLYPKTVYALVFEMGGLLWFYTDTDGTQSFSLHRNNLAAEKADFAPLLRDIDRGFAGHVILPEAEAAPALGKTPPPNACLIESYAALRRRMESGETILSAKLLSYYVRGRRAGHTVLAYATPEGTVVVDPAAPEKPRRVRRVGLDDPMKLARAIQPGLPLADARWVPTAVTVTESLMAAATARPSRSALLQKNSSLE